MTTQNQKLTIRILLAISFILLGLSHLLSANHRSIAAVFDFYQLTAWLDVSHLSVFTGMGFLTAAWLVGISHSLSFFSRYANGLILFIVSIALISLLSEGRWIGSLGGFPAIGSGQGVIKYFALIPLAIFLFMGERFSHKQHALMNLFPVVLVLVWIGGMKFTQLEAEGIYDLVSTSPFMSWLYAIFSVQEASNVIGVYDLAFAALLAFSVIKRDAVAAIIAGLGCGAVFIMTQTFLVTTPGAVSSATVLTGTGQFVIKDLWFIANLVVILTYCIKNQKVDFTGDAEPA